MREDVETKPPIVSEKLKIRKPKRVAAGIKGVTESVSYTHLTLPTN